MPEINAADTVWVVVATALVFLMTPALALFYGGMVRGKNVLSTFMHCFFAIGLITVQWVVLGYSLAFGPSQGGLVGGLDHAFLEGVGVAPGQHGLGATIPEWLFAAYQMMFAIITPALIAGAYAERLKLSSYVVFTLLWATLVYDPLAHWVWHPQGWLFKMGALDFAGGTVVHVSAGMSALVFAIVLGKRRGYPQRKSPPHNLTLTMLGAGLLWFGWFGFNAGSALAANGTAVLAFINTHIAAATGALAWAMVDWVRLRRPSSLGVASGLVAGLVAITPAAGYVSPRAALGIGLIAGLACFAGVLLKNRFRYDDTLDAFGVHGVGGAVGALLTGVFGSVFAGSAVAPGSEGLLSGGTALFTNQVIAVCASTLFALVMTYGILKLVDRLMGLRVTQDDEQQGLDVTLHGEEGYALVEGPGSRVVEEEGRAAEPRVVAPARVLAETGSGS
jgi:Amt family ammonium transporter